MLLTETYILCLQISLSFSTSQVTSFLISSTAFTFQFSLVTFTVTLCEFQLTFLTLAFRISCCRNIAKGEKRESERQEGKRS